MASGAGGRPADLAPRPLPVHAAVLAINEAVERGVAADTLAALQNPSALLGDVRGPLAATYQELLAQAKREKATNARSRVRRRLGVHGLGGRGPGHLGETEAPCSPPLGSGVAHGNQLSVMRNDDLEHRASEDRAGEEVLRPGLQWWPDRRQHAGAGGTGLA